MIGGVKEGILDLYGETGRWGWIPAPVFTGAGSPREKRMGGGDP